MTSLPPRIWALLGPHRGDNNQVLALAEALRLPFETRTLNYNILRKLRPHRLGESLLSVTPESRRKIAPPWPDLVIGIGRRSVPVARWIRRSNGGRTKLVRLGDPKSDPGLFDLVISTPQYVVPPADNLLRLPLAISRHRVPPTPEPDEKKFIAAWRHPRLLLALGGRTKLWQISADVIAATVQRLRDRALKSGGSLVVVSSPRTEAALIDAVRGAVPINRRCRIVEGGSPRFPLLLAAADEIFVTADSVSMVSEAILTGKPVGLVPIELSAEGREKLGIVPQPGSDRRDLRRFWARLEELGLVGTVEAPVAGPVEDSLTVAARAVQELLDRPAP